jgi:tetratricopeptide (TPR) repeat protein
MNLNNPVFNKLLRIKEHIVLGPGAKKKLFEKVKRKVSKGNQKSIKLSPLEIELLLDALERAGEYEFALDKIEEALDWGYSQVGKLQSARSVYFEHGRTERTLKEVAKVIDAPRKGIPWNLIKGDLKCIRFFVATGQKFKFHGRRHKPPMTQEEIVRLLYRKHGDLLQSEGSMIRGLRRKGVKNLPTLSFY